MSELAIIAESSVPKLARHARLQFDKARDRWIVQAPERLFVPDATALEILQHCKGDASVGAIVDVLAAKYDQAPREVIARDVTALLQDLADKGIVVA